MKEGFKQYIIASSVLIGTAIGAGVLGIPYVASKLGFFPTLGYILGVGLIILLVNLYLGEIALRTKGDHQLSGYVKKYLGRRARQITEIAFIFGLYASIVAYMLGVGQSLSYIFFGSIKYSIIFGVLFGIFMAYLLIRGLTSLKSFEKWGVFIVLALLVVISAVFLPKVQFANLLGFNSSFLFFPFGVVLFAFMSFQSISQVRLVLKGNEKYFRRVMFTGVIVSIVFYALFTFVVVGAMGSSTPQVATLALGRVFVILGIFTMFTSALANGNAVLETFQFDERFTRLESWLLAAALPIVLFLLTQLTNFFSFTSLLSIGGVVSGGIVAIMVLLMVGHAKKNGKRKPEYTVFSNKVLTGILILLFLVGMVAELIH